MKGLLNIENLKKLKKIWLEGYSNYWGPFEINILSVGLLSIWNGSYKNLIYMRYISKVTLIAFLSKMDNIHW